MRHSPPSSTQPTGCALPVNKGIQHPPPFPLTHAKCCQIDLIKGISSPGCNCCDAMARTSRMRCLLLLNYDRNSESGSGAAELLTIHPSTAPSSEEPVTVGSYLSSLGARAQLQVSLYRRKCIWALFSLFSFASKRASLFALDQGDLAEFALLIRL